MAFCNINDINLNILTRISDLKLFVNLSTIDKKSYAFITNTLVYKELNTLKNSNAKLKERNIIDKYYKLGLINILTRLKQNDEHFISSDSINWASKHGARINYASRCIINSQLRENIKLCFIFSRSSCKYIRMAQKIRT